jgi:hypothetical protein
MNRRKEFFLKSCWAVPVTFIGGALYTDWVAAVAALISVASAIGLYALSQREEK